MTVKTWAIIIAGCLAIWLAQALLWSGSSEPCHETYAHYGATCE